MILVSLNRLHLLALWWWADKLINLLIRLIISIFTPFLHCNSLIHHTKRHFSVMCVARWGQNFLILAWRVSCHEVCLQIICMAAGVYFLLEPMVLSVLYIWCQLNKDQIVQFWFGTQFKAMYLPWILVAFNMILRGGGMNELIGILVGHSYYFLMFKYPQDFGGRTFLSTPQIL